MDALWLDLVFLVVGAFFLYFGGDALVDGAVKLARAIGMTSLTIGLTVVAFGTSAPELAATLVAAFQGQGAIAFGNVVGSNIANLGLILGIAALLRPVSANAAVIWREVPVMVGAMMLMSVLAFDGVTGRLEGALLLCLIVPYLGFMFYLGKTPEGAEVTAEYEREFGPPPGEEEAGDTATGDAGQGPSTAISALKVALGIALLVLGAQALVTGAVGLAREVGISERIIGLTVVAFGTSLPELAAAVVAAVREEGDIVLGNLIGSNIFNSLVIYGSTSMAEPIRVDPAGALPDLLVMVAFGLVLWPLLWTSARVTRWEGVALLAAYGGYLAWLVRGG